MTLPPAQPKIYHITHVENLASIIAAGCIESDGKRLREGMTQTAIGMTEIKRRRLFELDVSCHPGTKVGDYVPFYFCPRSIMLFIIHCDNHPDMTYHGGQGPILHLQADMESVINWADVKWGQVCSWLLLIAPLGLPISRPLRIQYQQNIPAPGTCHEPQAAGRSAAERLLGSFSGPLATRCVTKVSPWDTPTFRNRVGAWKVSQTRFRKLPPWPTNFTDLCLW